MFVEDLARLAAEEDRTGEDTVDTVHAALNLAGLFEVGTSRDHLCWCIVYVVLLCHPEYV